MRSTVQQGARLVPWMSAWGPVAAYAGLIFWLSHQTHPPIELPGWEGSDKVAHAVEYAILAALVWRALGRNRAGAGRWIVALIVSMTYAASDEWHQSFVPGRHASVADWAADSVGALLLLLAFHVKMGHSRDAVRRRVENTEVSP